MSVIFVVPVMLMLYIPGVPVTMLLAISVLSEGFVAK